ncbi:amino acid adenylation domain-containing protein, partial [Streptomyces sp. NPDC038707]|uniref:amino acid adenylation domain-containing protein n=1 Tax=Streptomyces sp. NPDC038707 TaxID=3154329 RepID=UPI0033D7293C
MDQAGLSEANARAGITCTGMRPYAGTHYPLTVTADIASHLKLALQYQPDVFDHAYVEEVGQRFLRVLRHLVDEPDRLVGRVDVLAPRERDHLLRVLNDTAVPFQERTVPELFERRAATAPDAEALVCGDVSLSYGELNARANRLAHWLIGRGVGPETLVAVALPRSADLIVTLLAVLKAGGAYLPLDLAYPAERISYLLEDARPGLVVTDAGFAEALPDFAEPVVLDDPALRADLAARPDRDPTNPDRRAALHPRNPAYVIYTSGSTGRPKGVVVAHAGVANLAAWGVAEFGAETFSRALATTSTTFDVSVFDTLVPLLVGGSIMLLDDALAVVEQDTGAASLLCVVPSVLDAMADRAPLDRIGTIVLAGEALPSTLVRKLRDTAPGVRLANVYGPTEATVYAAGCVDDGTGDGHLPIGRPLANCRTYVLDSRLGLAPLGVPGELYLAGAGLARGYLDRPGLSAERFVADPYGPPGARMYRTGDLARWGADGNLEYLGRADMQAKVRGFRVEPGEIEAVLAAHPAVERAVVITRAGLGPGKQLVAYTVPAQEGAQPPADELKRYVGERLPEYMVPAAIVPMDRLPLTPNGKLDRAALPDPEFTGEAYRAPRTAAERTLAALFADVLGVERVGLDDSFFALGGHSLLATQLVSRIRSAFTTELRIRTVFESPTVAALAGHLTSGDRPRPVLRPRADRSGTVPVSFAQRRLWFLHRFEGPSATYNIPVALRLSGPLDTDALSAAVRDVVLRHESLRTVLVEDADGMPYQRVVPADELAFDVPLSPVPPHEVPAALAAAMEYRFDLFTEVPIRAELFRRSAREHVLGLVVHHIAADGESMAPLARDLAAAYAARLAGREPVWDESPVQYTDYTLWQRDLLGAEDDPHSLVARQSGYWLEELAGIPQPLQLPTDRPRPPVAGRRGDGLEFAIEPGLLAAARELARGHDVTMPMVLQSVLAVLLGRLGCGEDISIGSPIAGRTDEELAGLVGFFVNTWVLRVDLSGNPTFREVLGRVRSKALAAYDHQDVPFEHLVEILNPERSSAYHPLFQVMLAWQDDNTLVDFDLAGVRAELEIVPTRTAKFDLQFNFGLDASGEGLGGYVEYATDLFDRGSVEALVGRFVRVLRQVVADPG